MIKGLLKKLLLPGLAMAVFIIAIGSTLAAQGRLGAAFQGFPKKPPAPGMPGEGGTVLGSDEGPVVGEDPPPPETALRQFTISELEALVSEIQKTRDLLEARSATLDNRELLLAAFRKEVEAEKTTVGELQNNMARREADVTRREAEMSLRTRSIDSVKAAALARLAAFYDDITPVKAAEMLVSRDTLEGAKILFFMSNKQAAKVLESLPTDARTAELLDHFNTLHLEDGKQNTGGAR